LFRLIGNLLSPAGERGKLSILIYHRMLSAPDALLHDEIDARTFERQIGLLAREFNVLTLGEACERLQAGALPARAVSITFDDGYSDNEAVALPILKRLKVPATFFVATGFSNGTAMFNDVVIEAIRRAQPGVYDLSTLGVGIVRIGDILDRRTAVGSLLNAIKYRSVADRRSLAERIAESLGVPAPRKLMMTPQQIRRLHAEGMEIGAHTVNHPILASTDDKEAKEEIVSSKRTLEEIVDAPIKLFAYPNGKPGQDYGPQHVKLVKEAGFIAAVSTLAGIAHRGSSLFELPRFGPWERNPRRLGLRLMMACARTPGSATSAR
jgi:peptidoglycan/xylan/chitin deacetylase (PgdA/CDA1 family)